mgnify:FL=1
MFIETKHTELEDINDERESSLPFEYLWNARVSIFLDNGLRFKKARPNRIKLVEGSHWKKDITLNKSKHLLGSNREYNQGCGYQCIDQELQGVQELDF